MTDDRDRNRSEGHGEQGDMTRRKLVLSALAYRRHTGASLGDIRAFASIREEVTCSQKEDREILSRLEREGMVYRVGKRWFFTPKGYKEAKGPSLQPEWEPSDALILLAILCLRNSAASELYEIIGVADYINHAIPTIEEMHGALNRLAAGGLIKSRKNGITATDKSVSLYEKVEATYKRYVLDQLDGLQNIMKCPCCGVRLKRVRWSILMDKATYDSAVSRYLGLSNK